VSVLCDKIAEVVLADFDFAASAAPVSYGGSLHQYILNKFNMRFFKFEVYMRNVMRQIFRDQRVDILDKFFRNPPKSYRKDYTDNLFDRDKWDDIVRERGGTVIRQTVIVEGSDVSAQFGTSFNVRDPNVQGFLDRKVFNPAVYNFPIMVNDTTESMVRVAISSGIRLGENVNEIAQRLDSVFDFAVRSRTRTIARTEVNEAMNFAANESYRQTGRVGKRRWIATLDDRVRDSHSRMHNQVAVMGRMFSNGMEFPGDSRIGKPEELVNCRCTTVAILSI